MTLWVIDPSLAVAEREGIREVVGDWPGDHRVFFPALRPGDGPAPADGHEADAIVVMGSAASVEDDLPWLRDLAAWLRPVVEGEIRRPLLGICFGHQLVAHLAGGEVRFMDEAHTKRVGVETSVLRPSRLAPAGGGHRVVVSHREAVTRAPAGYEVVATRPGVPVDGLQHPALPIATVQFHPEARNEFASRAGIAPTEIDDRLRADSGRLLAAFRAEALAASR